MCIQMASKNALDQSAGTALGTALTAVDSLTSLDIRYALSSVFFIKCVFSVQKVVSSMYQSV